MQLGDGEAPPGPAVWLPEAWTAPSFPGAIFGVTSSATQTGLVIFEPDQPLRQTMRWCVASEVAEDCATPRTLASEDPRGVSLPAEERTESAWIERLGDQAFMLIWRSEVDGQLRLLPLTKGGDVLGPPLELSPDEISEPAQGADDFRLTVLEGQVLVLGWTWRDTDASSTHLTLHARDLQVNTSRGELTSRSLGTRELELSPPYAEANLQLHALPNSTPGKRPSHVLAAWRFSDDRGWARALAIREQRAPDGPLVTLGQEVGPSAPLVTEAATLLAYLIPEEPQPPRMWAIHLVERDRGAAVRSKPRGHGGPMMCHARSIIALALGVATLVAPLSTQAQSPSKRARFGVLALDESEGTRLAARAVTRKLRRNGHEVRDQQELHQLLRRRLAPEPDEETSGRLAQASGSIAEGIRIFFYESQTQAIELLSPAFNAGMANRAVLARRRDLAAQIYEAGVFLMRSYQETNQDEEALAVASLLARHFPHKSPDNRTAPPEVVEFVDAQKKKRMSDGTQLVLEPLGQARDEDCTLTLNGLPVVKKRPYPVDARLTYYARVECPTRSSKVWALELEAGRTHRVPLIVESPFELRLRTDSLEARERVESQLQFLRYWSGVDLALGVSARGSQESRDAALIARVEADLPPRWSDERSLEEVLPRIIPEYLGGSAQPPVRTDRSGPGPLPWVMTSAGILGLGVGGFLTWQGAQQLDRARCSEASASRDPATCQDVEDAYTYEELGESEQEQIATLNARFTQAQRQRNLGLGVTIAGGVLTLGGLTWWWLGRDADEDTRAHWHLAPAPGGGAVSIQGRF